MKNALNSISPRKLQGYFLKEYHFPLPENLSAASRSVGLNTMNRRGARHSSPRGRSSRYGSVGARGYFRNSSSGRGVWQIRRQNPEMTPVENITSSAENLNLVRNTTKVEDFSPKHRESASAIGSRSHMDIPSLSTPPNLNEKRTHQEQSWDAGKESCTSPHLIGTSPADASCTKKGPSQSGVFQSRTSATENTVGDGRSNDSESLRDYTSYNMVGARGYCRNSSSGRGVWQIRRQNPEMTPVENITSSAENLNLGKRAVLHPTFIGTSPADASCTKKGPSQSGVFQSRTGATENTVGDGRSNDSDSLQKGFSFDICVEKIGSVVRLKPPLLLKNREKRNEMKRLTEGENIKVLRPGMVLLKGYLPLTDQVKLVKMCRDLGLGSGGFYEPGYRNGAQLHLKMMCLGKNWDPETSVYSEERPIDGAKPPTIPAGFQQLVKGALKDSRAYLESITKVRNVEDILPSMSPNICIVNFYTNSGRLGLHQDKDESQESLRKRLPVVSFSMGDSAEFLYGEQMDIDNAEKVVLESGDVLIFGGKSRHIFHGVSSVIPNTGPTVLLEESNMRPGRLNLTFREY
ncbi:putative 2-oxoglutarate-dependent dioxygenase family protein [Abeliophyllum distichum]|uniref:DNA N(6)-methyladenine demethylase n=1 Tax=Abeliophyllum distichum TaxID=126358 RepID=A0ABD1VNX6_9LAMI